MLLTACGGSEPPSIPPASAAAPEYSGSEACQGCHEQQYAAWQRSQHRMAMQPASANTVVGDFSGTSFKHGDVVYEFFRREGGFFVKADDSDGTLREFEISHTFGVEPLQQYLVSFPDGRLQALPVAWDTRPADAGGQRWFHLYPDQAIAHDDELHWTGRNQNWNFMCADCHSTDLRKNYAVATNTYATAWAEVTVGCEACHGPATQHVADAAGDSYEADGPGNALATQAGEIESCARCHARRGILAEGFEPGAAFLDHYRPALLEDGLYHADGQILDEVYVYGSFLQSKMHMRGVRCSDCHDPHSAELGIGGNGTCTACHRQQPPARFPTIAAGVYDHPDHHFHEPGTEGAQCVSCHMPASLYMVIDARRDHSFRIPRPDISIATGAPNACNGCHADRDADWSAAEIARRYPGAKPPHYGETIAAGRRGEPDAAPRLASLAADDNAPAIVRGTALSLLQGFDDPLSIGALQAGLRDPAALVRQGALEGIGRLDPEQRWRMAQHLLGDELLAVRSDAALALLPMLDRDLRQADRERLLAAVSDYVETQLLNADRPEALTNLGGVYARAGRDEQAEKAYRQALALDPEWLPALVNLADFYRSSDRDAEAAGLLTRAQALAPDNAAVRYAYGLLLARERRMDEALAELERATRLDPDSSRYRYVYGVALNSTGRAAEAVEFLEAGLGDFPGNSDILFALATIERDRGNVDDALRYVEQLLELRPGDPGLLQFRQQLESAVSNREP